MEIEIEKIVIESNKMVKERRENLKIEHIGGLRVEGKDKENTGNDEDGFKLVQRKKKKIAFEKFVKMEEVFKKVENMSDKELEEIERFLKN